MSSTASTSKEELDINKLEKGATISIHTTSSIFSEYDIEIDSEEDKRVMRKIDWMILPLVSGLYLLSFLDKSNIGNAKIVGLTTDLHLKGLQYNVCAAVFYITYAFSEVPSNILLKVIRPSVWIPSIMLAWGIVMIIMSQVKNYQGLLVARLFLGIAEAGLFPGVNFFLTMWYRRKELAFRIAIFFSAGTIAGAFGGLLAAGLATLNGLAGLHGWQWIFLMEGLATTVIAGSTFFTLPDYPETATFLTKNERKHVIKRLAVDKPSLATSVRKEFFFQAIGDYHTYLLMFAFLGVIIPLSAFSLFLPSIIAGLGYTAERAQLLSVPPYVVGSVVSLAVASYSDKLHIRAPFIMTSAGVAISGYAVLLATKSPEAAYAGSFLCAIGIFPTIPLIISWAGNNIGGDLKRSVVIAMVIGWGNLGGVCASFVYLAQQAPRYPVGHSVCLASLAMTILCAALLAIDYSCLNMRRDLQCAHEGILPEHASRYGDLGDKSPLFRYTL